MRGNHRQGIIDERYFKIEDRGYVTPCWIWQRATVGKKGYGQVVFRGSQMVAHRAVWIERNGPWPEGLQADHLCKVKPCVNPDHIEPVTASVNMRRSPRAVISEEQLPTLHRLYAEGWSVRALSRHYGCTRDSIKRNLGIGGRYGPTGTHSLRPSP